MHGTLSHTRVFRRSGARSVELQVWARVRGLFSTRAGSLGAGLTGIFDARWLASMGAVQNVTETMPLPARLIDSAIALARAELALVLAHTRELAVRAFTALAATLVATMVAAAFAQTALLLLVLLPLLAQVIAIETLVVAIVLSVGVAFAAAIGAVLSWRKVRRSVSVEPSEVSSLAGERAADVPGLPEQTRPPRPAEPRQRRPTPPVTLTERTS